MTLKPSKAWIVTSVEPASAATLVSPDHRAISETIDSFTIHDAMGGRPAVGKVEKLEGLPGGAAARLRGRAEPCERIRQIFVGSADLHRIDRSARPVTHFVSSNRKVIEHLKLTWKIAADSTIRTGDHEGVSV